MRDDTDSDDDWSNSAFAYFSYIHLRDFDVVEEIVMEKTLYFPSIK